MGILHTIFIIIRDVGNSPPYVYYELLIMCYISLFLMVVTFCAILYQITLHSHVHTLPQMITHHGENNYNYN